MPSWCWKTSPRHMDTGLSRMEATLLGTREVGFTVLSMSVVADRSIRADPA